MFLSSLAQKMGISEDVAKQFLVNAPQKYKVYTIPKRTSGFRIIAQPSKELKEYQRQFSKLFILPVHDRAMAYRDGRSIKNNAMIHKDNCYLLKMDLENFFNSITPNVFWNVWQERWALPDKRDRYFIESLIFWKLNESLVLSVGSPSSPYVSNFCLYFFDERINNYCLENDISYSRYADDLTFSTNIRNILFDIPSLISRMLDESFNGSLKVNRGKTVFSSKAHNRHVTGITISNDGVVSLGRGKKRYIKHLLHHYTLGLLDSNEINHLKGLISFSKFIDPLFFNSLKLKYSENIVNQLLKEKNEQK